MLKLSGMPGVITDTLSLWGASAWRMMRRKMPANIQSATQGAQRPVQVVSERDQELSRRIHAVIEHLEG
jgi:hypothetical protein